MTTQTLVNPSEEQIGLGELSVRFLLTGADTNGKLSMFEMNEGLENESLGHRFLYAFLCYRVARFEDAEYLMEKVVEDEQFVATFPTVLYYAGKIHLYRDHYETAVEYFSRFYETEIGSQPE